MQSKKEASAGIRNLPVCYEVFMLFSQLGISPR